MNYLDLYSSYPDRVVVAAWDSQIKEANKTPWITETLNQGDSELFASFSARYAELRELPRGARRSLQRRLARSNELAAVLPEYLQQGGRRLQHRMAWSLAGAALLLALSQGIAMAATITVTTDNPNIVADGQCSLIEAIVNANNDAATHADCPAGNGADTVVLPASANVALSSAYGTFFTSAVGLPLITSRITIEGNGATIARQGNAPGFGLMAVTYSGTYSGDLTLQSVTLSGGSSGYGGAVAVFAGTLTIENSTVSGNTATNGGGVYNYYGYVTIENSTISGNIAERHGGGVSSRFGGLTITNSTISGNRANNAGGVYKASFFGTDILIVANSLIAGNQAPEAPEIENGSGGFFVGTVNANNFNLFGTNGNPGVTGFTPGPNDIVPRVSLAQIIGPLQDNGGPTQTHALVPGSPAINAGDPNGCRDDLGALLLTDQRGFSRPFQNTICDIGSYEVQANPLNIGATTLATGEIGVFFISDLMISGGVAPYGVSIAKGKLPAGLSLGNDGIISGTLSPTARTEKITVQITDVNESISKTFTITVLKAVHIAGKPKTGRVGNNYTGSLKTRGGLGPFNWNITSGAVPGLSFNNATGALTGIPTQAGEFPLTVQVMDALGGVDVESLILKIR